MKVNPWLVLAVVAIGNLTSAVMGSSVNVVLPLIRTEFGVGLSTIEWVVTGYLLTSAAFLTFFGRLGDMVGQKRVYCTGYTLFTIGSIACGFAPSITYLIAGRVLQALGGAMLWAISSALVTSVFPPQKRGQALGLQAAAVYVGLTLGPTFGGVVADWLGWQWVFLLLVPFSALCAVLAIFLLPTSKPGARQPFDPAGALLFATALSALLTGLSKGGDWGWGSPLTIGVLALAVIAAGLFIWVESKVAAPMIPLSIFHNVVFRSGISASLTSYAIGAMLTFLLPFYLIEFRGFSPRDAGLIMSVQAITMVTLAPITGWISDRVGSRGLAAAGIGLQGVALFSVAQLTSSSPFWIIALVQFAMGLGVGLFTTPNNSAIMGAAPPERQGVAAGLMAAARTTGMVVGVAVAGAIFRGMQSLYLAAGATESGAFLSAMSGALYTGAGLAILGVLLALARGRLPQALAEEQVAQG